VDENNLSMSTNQKPIDAAARGLDSQATSFQWVGPALGMTGGFS
jgi:hypothetical protein